MRMLPLIIFVVVFISVFGLVIGGFIYIIRTNSKRWKSIPSIDDYKNKHPDCVTNKGMKCAVCNSTSIKSMGFGHAEAVKRIFICNHCGTQLYRTNN